MEELEVGLLEQALGRTIGVRRVGDDDIEGVLVLVEELEAVTNVNGALGVSETLGHTGQVLLGKAGDGLLRVNMELARRSRNMRVPRQCRRGWPPQRSRA